MAAAAPIITSEFKVNTVTFNKKTKFSHNCHLPSNSAKLNLISRCPELLAFPSLAMMENVSIFDEDNRW